MPEWTITIKNAQDRYTRTALIVDMSRGDDRVRYIAARSSRTKSGWSLEDCNAGGRTLDSKTRASARRAALRELRSR